MEISFWYFLLALPISLSGLRVRQGAYVYLFAQSCCRTPTSALSALELLAWELDSQARGKKRWISPIIPLYNEEENAVWPALT